MQTREVKAWHSKEGQVHIEVQEAEMLVNSQQLKKIYQHRTTNNLITNTAMANKSKEIIHSIQT